jgi:hypothetical protein
MQLCSLKSAGTSGVPELAK